MLYFAIAQILLMLYVVFMLVGFLRHHREHMPQLNSLGWQPIEDGVLIVVPAKDEEESVTACLEGLTHLNGIARYQVMAVNDRSTDQTLTRMREVERKHPGRIEAVDIRELPAGWLGKNHACWTGAQRGFESMPDAKYILFTDGDVKFHPDSLAEAISWMKRENIDFMSLLEEPEYGNPLEAAYLLLFGLFLIFFAARPWSLRKKNGRNFMGNGAFLLATRDAYEKSQGHKTLRLEVVEDMRMGLLMRSLDLRCAAAVGLDRVRRRWQPGFMAVFKGLIKNAFAGFEYNVPKAVIGILCFPFVVIGPWLCVLGGYPLIGGINLALLIAGFYLAGKKARLPWLTSFLLSPFTALTASTNLAYSAFKTLKDGGVTWRSTVYPLAELKAHCFTMRKAYGGRADENLSAART